MYTLIENKIHSSNKWWSPDAYLTTCGNGDNHHYAKITKSIENTLTKIEQSSLTGQRLIYWKHLAQTPLIFPQMCRSVTSLLSDFIQFFKNTNINHLKLNRNWERPQTIIYLGFLFYNSTSKEVLRKIFFHG